MCEPDDQQTENLLGGTEGRDLTMCRYLRKDTHRHTQGCALADGVPSFGDTCRNSGASHLPRLARYGPHAGF
jgi:hypothetical protein